MRTRGQSVLERVAQSQERFGGTTLRPGATGTRSSRQKENQPSLQVETDIPEDTEHLDQDMAAAMARLDLLRRRSYLKAHEAVRVQPKRRRKRVVAPLCVVSPPLTKGYEEMTHHQQTVLKRVVGTGHSRTSTTIPVAELKELAEARQQDARAESTWTSLGCPYNQFVRWQQEVLGDEINSIDLGIQVQWWAESKLKDKSISMLTAHKYVRRIRQVWGLTGQSYMTDSLTEYLKALSRGGRAPEFQAPPATRADILESGLYLSPEEFIGAMTGWKTASRTGELQHLTRECLERRVIITADGVEKTIWIITFPYHKGDPFRLGTSIPVDFGEWEPQIANHWERLPPGARWTSLTTERITAVLGRVREGLTSHSIKRGALLAMLTAGTPLALIQAIAKHRDMETLLIYLPRAEVAMALGIWEATEAL